MNDRLLAFRHEVRPVDAGAVHRLAAATGFFTPAEVAIAVELIEERLLKGEASGYRFVLAEEGEEVLGYTCFGPIPCTRASYDLYWIVVDPRRQGRGIGRALLAASEAAVRTQGGLRVYVETSSRGQYEPTRAFYCRAGYRQAAFLEDFYAPGDGKLIYCKVLPPAAKTERPSWQTPASLKPVN